METILIVLQLIAALLLVLVIMIQEKGSGFGEAIGGSAGSSSFQTSKRGAEKVLGSVTVGLLSFFIVLSVVLNFV